MVKVGIVGAGFMGGMHAECYNNLPNAKLLAIADTDLTKAENLAKNIRLKLTKNLRISLKRKISR
ncbi:Gfo/Idh/MocA family oxidoreductase [Candidatus Aerophobetes bacterium]|nr:Gfo/Idh/MocA family oxidoreductase [Candidatus Aerophobetes bacterium]